MDIHAPYETRSALPIETRSEDPNPDVAALTTAIEEIRTAVEGNHGKIDQRLTAEMTKLTKRLEAVEVRSQRPGATTTETTDAAKELHRRAFGGFMRHGVERLSADEVRSMIVGDDARGGFLAPPEFSAEVIKNIVEFSPVRQAARVGTTTAGEVLIPKRTGAPSAYWVDEQEDRTETTPSYGQALIPISEAACYIDVSLKLLEDSAQNVEAEIAMDLAEEFGRLEGEAFIEGNGVKRPLGLMSATGIAYTPAGNTSDFHATTPGDAFITLLYALPAFYRNRGAWMMNGATLAKVRKFKEATTNAYIWQPGLAAGQPETILGRPVIEAVDMPDVNTDTYPVLFGDFQSAYRIYDRVALTILRDPYSQATKGMVRFHARRRVGGTVVKTEALRKLKIASS